MFDSGLQASVSVVCACCWGGQVGMMRGGRSWALAPELEGGRGQSGAAAGASEGVSESDRARADAPFWRPGSPGQDPLSLLPRTISKNSFPTPTSTSQQVQSTKPPTTPARRDSTNGGSAAVQLRARPARFSGRTAVLDSAAATTRQRNGIQFKKAGRRCGTVVGAEWRDDLFALSARRGQPQTRPNQPTSTCITH